MTKKTLRIAVTGAAGQIAYALLPRLANGDAFGPDVHIDLNLLEVPAAMPALQGCVMELQDGAYPLLDSINCFDDVNAGMKDVDIAILVGAVPRKKGMERADLLKINAAIFKAQGQAIQQHAADNVKVLVVGNPCNTNALITYHHAPRVVAQNFYAMTLLDEKRARIQLALKAGVHVSAIDNMIIWGNHSATQFPDVAHATINGQPAMDVIADAAWVEDEFIPTIQQRGAEIIKARGASSAASAANAILGSLRNMVCDTEVLHSLACVSQGEYDVDAGLVFSFPCVTRSGAVQIIADVEHTDAGKAKLQITLDELRKERDAVRAMGLLDVDV